MFPGKRVACIAASHDLRLSQPVDGVAQPATIFDLLPRNVGWHLIPVDADVEGLAAEGKAAVVRLAEELLRKGFEYDAIFAGAEDIGIPLAAFAVQHLPRIPVNIWTMGALLSWPEDLALVRSLPNTVYLTLSEAIRAHLLRSLNTPPERVVNVGYAVDTDFYRPMQQPDSPLVMSVGLQDRDYGTFLSAVADLDVNVAIAAASGWRPDSFARMRPGRARNIAITAYENRVHLRQLYARASFVVVPLYPVPSASGCTAIAEAMSMGKAVIATGTEGRCDYLRHGETGLFVAAGNAAELRAAIVSLLEEPSLADRMGLEARRTMERESSLSALRERILAGMQFASPSREAWIPGNST